VEHAHLGDSTGSGLPSASLQPSASSSPSSSSTGQTTTPQPSAPTTTTTTPSAGAARTATGSDENFRYGDIAVKVTVDGSKITKIAIARIDETDPKSQQIDSYAVPQLERQVIDAQSARIQGVSGATYTTQAFDQSLSSALSQLGFQ
jgi:uncharacterized protein with FMN-binding domain